MQIRELEASEEEIMTKYKDRCGDCAFFPGNGVVCPKRPRRGIRVRVYKLDNRCDAFAKAKPDYKTCNCTGCM